MQHYFFLWNKGIYGGTQGTLLLVNGVHYVTDPSQLELNFSALMSSQKNKIHNTNVNSVLGFGHTTASTLIVGIDFINAAAYFVAFFAMD